MSVEVPCQPPAAVALRLALTPVAIPRIFVPNCLSGRLNYDYDDKYYFLDLYAAMVPQDLLKIIVGVLFGQ